MPTKKVEELSVGEHADFGIAGSAIVLSRCLSPSGITVLRLGMPSPVAPQTVEVTGSYCFIVDGSHIDIPCKIRPFVLDPHTSNTRE